MSLGLLFPLALAALAAWALPLLLHVVRREEQKPTDFAALRWLSAHLKPRRRLRFDDLPLLLLRLLLLAAMVLLLARPVLTGGAAETPWLLVHPALEPGAAAGLVPQGERRWLAQGFPPLDAPRPAGTPPASSLLREIDARLAPGTPVTVLVPPVLAGADGDRPRLSRTIDWRVVPTAAEATDAVASAPEATGFAFAVRHGPSQAAGLRYLRAAARALAPDATDTEADIAGLDAPLPATNTALAWLGDGALAPAVRAWIEAGGQALLPVEATWPLPDDGAVVWRDGNGLPLARAASLGRGRVVRLQQPLAPAALPAVLEPDFPQRLRDLFEGPAPAPTLADAASHAPLAGGPTFIATPRPFETPLLWLIALLFALERWRATRLRREATA